MLGKRSVWECNSKAVLVILLLVSSTSSFCMDSLSGYFFSDSRSVNTTSDEDKIFRLLHEELEKPDDITEKPETEISDNGCEKHDNDDLPEWLVESCIKNMPPLLNCIYQYLGSNAPDDPKQRISTFHRFLLVGPPGTSKSATAEAIAQRLGFQKKIIAATSLRGKYRGHTVKKIHKFFKRLKEDSRKRLVKTMLIVNEIHKLFEGHNNEHTDNSEAAASFCGEVDELERYYPNIISAYTANHIDKLPPEIQSRFRGQWIWVPLLSGERLCEVFDTIIAHDPSIRLDESISREDLLKFCSKSEECSVRDVKLLIDTAKIFTYADPADADCIVLKQNHFDQAIVQFDDPQKIMKFGEDQIDKDEQRHRENIDLHERHFVQQKIIEVNDLMMPTETLADGRLKKLRANFSDEQKIIMDRLLDEKQQQAVTAKKKEEAERKARVAKKCQEKKDSVCSVM